MTQLPQTQSFDYTCLIIVDTAAGCNTTDLGFLQSLFDTKTTLSYRDFRLLKNQKVGNIYLLYMTIGYLLTADRLKQRQSTPITFSTKRPNSNAVMTSLSASHIPKVSPALSFSSSDTSLIPSRRDTQVFPPLSNLFIFTLQCILGF